MTENGPAGWGAVAKALHWLFVVLILVEVPAGLLMAATYGPEFKAPAAARLHVRLEQIHHTIGFCLLALLAVRLTWRFTRRAPGEGRSGSRLTRLAARSVQGLLYLLLALLPLSGWAALSTLGDSAAYGHTAIWFLGADGVVPRLAPPQPVLGPFGYASFAHLHLLLLYTGGVLISLHIAAALWSHFGRSDDALRRMWPLAR